MTGSTSTRPTRPALPESTRVEAFSDGVFAIAITLLVLELRSEFDHGQFLHQIGERWPSYVAYLAAFLNIAAIWINHHDVFTRVRAVDAGLITINLGILLIASLLPWPTAVISAAQHEGSRSDQITASVLYAAIAFLVPLTFIAVATYLARRPHLLVDPSQVAWARAARRRALLSVVVYPITAALAFVSATLSLALFFAVPVFFIAAMFAQERSEAQATG